MEAEASLLASGACGWPTCQRCHKPVDDVRFREAVPILASGSMSRRYVLVATCHGAQDIIEIPESALRDVRGPQDISLDGPAFIERPKLPAQGAA